MDIQIGYFPQVLVLVLVRILAVIGTLPFFGGPKTDLRIRMVLALSIAIILLPVLPPAWADSARQIRDMPQLVFAMLGEVLLGAGISFVCNAFIAACQIGGMVAGRSSSLMMARVMDPLSGTDNPILSEVLQMAFIIILLVSNGHLMLIKMLAHSFESINPFTTWLDGDFMDVIFSLGSRMFEWGLKFAMPALSVSLIISVGLGLIARLAPDFNILFLSMPIHVLSGICIFGLMILFGADSFQNLMEEMLNGCARILRL